MIPQPSLVSVGARAVGVYEYGDRDGSPVFAFHGVPSCGAGFDWSDEPAKQRGLRILAPDRPGVGLSSPRQPWRVADYPAMLAALANELRVDRFAVWGYSGGGPYAVATAALLGDRVTRTAICAGMGEIGEFATVSDFEGTDSRLLPLSQSHPWLAQLLLEVPGRLARFAPKIAYDAMAKELSESDRAVVSSLPGGAAEAMAMFTQAFLRGARGVVHDYAAVGQRWGIDFAAISTPVRVFQGTADRMVPEQHAHDLLARIPGAELVLWPGEGHLGVITHVGDVLDWLG